MATIWSRRLVKFSYALSAPAEEPEWTHLLHRPLQVILQRDGSSGAIMEVMDGDIMVEQLDVAGYIRRAKRFRYDMEQAGKDFNTEKVPIFGITKVPLLAIRYQLHQKARRMQLKFENAEDFQQMVGILSRLGMELHTPTRPSTSSARPDTAQHGDRLLTARTTLISENGDTALKQNQQSVKPRAHPFKIPDIEAGSLSQPPLGNRHPSGNRASQLAVPARRASRDETLASREVVPSRPSTATPWEPRSSGSVRLEAHDVQPTTHADEAGGEALANPEPDRHATDNFFDFSAAVSSGGLPPLTSGLTSEHVDVRPSTSFSVTSGTSFMPDTLEHEIPPRRVLPFKATSDSRPSSGFSVPSATSFVMPDTLDLQIPPARELPFKVPRSRGSGSTSSRPGSALPQPPPKKAKTQKERPKTSSDSRSLNRLSVQSNIALTASKPTLAESGDVAVKAVPMHELIYGSDRFTNGRPRMSSTMDAPHEIEYPPVSPHKQRYSTSAQVPLSNAAVAEGSADNDRRPNFASASGDDSHVSSLDQYTSQTPEARQTALDQFMIENLQNPSFTTLCEDIEQCWRRIALGL